MLSVVSTHSIAGLTDICYTSDGGHFLTCGQDGNIHIFNTKTDEIKHIHCADQCYCLAVHDYHIFIGTNRNELEVRSFPHGDSLPSRVHFTQPVSALCLSKSSLFIGTKDFKVAMINLNDDTNEMKYFEGHQAPILSLNVYEEKRWIATSCCDGSIRIFNIDKQTLIKQLNIINKSNSIETSSSLVKIDWDKTDHLLAIPVKNTIQFYETDKWTRKQTYENDTIDKIINQISYSPCCTLFLISYTNGQLFVINRLTFDICMNYSSKDAVCAIAWNPIETNRFTCATMAGEYAHLDMTNLVSKSKSEDKNVIPNEYIYKLDLLEREKFVKLKNDVEPPANENLSLQIITELAEHSARKRDEQQYTQLRSKEHGKTDVYVSTYATGFKDFLFKPELLDVMMDCGLEHPSEVQHQSIPQAVRGTDILCKAEAGTGKTTVFVLATLQQIQSVDEQVLAIVLCHTRELAFQISREYERFCKYMPNVKVSVLSGGLPTKSDEDVLKKNCPHIIVGTPGRILALAKSKALNLQHIKHFIIDECDKVLEPLDMRRDIQEIFKMTPHEKQVLMFSATLSKEIRPVCKKFMQDPIEIYIDNKTKLTLHGLCQHYVQLNGEQKYQTLIDLLAKLEFNQLILFVRAVSRCRPLCTLLNENNFSAVEIHCGMPQEERLARYKEFEKSQTRILVTTNSFERGLDIERVNIVFNYDMPKDPDTYLHRVARTGRFGAKGLAITYVTNESNENGESDESQENGESDENRESDETILNKIQRHFAVQITELPDGIDPATYIENR